MAENTTLPGRCTFFDQRTRRSGFCSSKSPTVGAKSAVRYYLWQATDQDSAVTQLLQDKLNMIETRIAELGQLRQELQQRLGQRCPLNSSFAP